ncbi:MAG: hypothetical protein EOP45_22165 [Sphingobacteriaceae bacterium]|nr:MAG: hypothetical protein EOP45_22165 [Sphingobacteriaceae bacterium]
MQDGGTVEWSDINPKNKDLSDRDNDIGIMIYLMHKKDWTGIPPEYYHSDMMLRVSKGVDEDSQMGKNLKKYGVID